MGFSDGVVRVDAILMAILDPRIVSELSTLTTPIFLSQFPCLHSSLDFQCSESSLGLSSVTLLVAHHPSHMFHSLTWSAT